ncbi:MAG: tetratricopeptide repeat protein, partial [Alphaproteobacteria bacterium]|nr:tetratricopeptide repeat protein [Alphaproteobacteria bacterium]
SYSLRGNAYRNKGDIDHALADYDKAIELDPKYAAAYYNRGFADVKKGWVVNAVTDFWQALSGRQNGKTGDF